MTTYVLRKKPKPDLNAIEVDGVPIMFCDTSEKIDQVLRMLRDAERVGLDTEYYGHRHGKESPFGKAKPVSMQLSARGPKLKGVHWANAIMIPNWGDMKHIRHFKKFLADERQTKVLHNAKADFHPLENIGCPLRGFRADTMVQCYIANTSPLHDHSLKGQCNSRFNKYLPDYSEAFRVPVLKKNGEPGKKTRVPQPNELVNGSLDRFFPGSSAIVEFTKYAVKDPILTLDLEEDCEDQLRDLEWVGGKSMFDYYRMFEREYTEVLYSMERIGCYVDATIAGEVYEQLQKVMVDAEKEFYKQCVKLGATRKFLAELMEGSKGKNGLLGSKPKLGKLFTEHFGMKLPKSPKGGQVSVKTAVLQKVKTQKVQGVIKALLTWREINEKLLGTYMKPICQFASEPIYQSRVRTTYKQIGTVSGRLASEAINLQNIPTRTALGKLIRSVFTAPDDCYFGDADQSQIELRIAAHQSQDEAMLATIRANMDMHSRTTVGAFGHVEKFVAQMMGGKFDPKKLTAEMLNAVKAEFADERGKAKTLNFLVLYGGGAGRYAAQTGASVEEGERVIANFFKAYPGLRKDMKRVLRQVRENGWVRTAYMKRYCHFPEIASNDFKKRGHAERAAYNATIQGGAAEVMKLVMLAIHRCDKLRDMDVKMMLQVHDELAFQIPKDVIEPAKKLINQYVARPYDVFGLKELRVPTPGDFRFGASWKDTH